MAGPYYKNKWGFAQCACAECRPDIDDATRQHLRESPYNQVAEQHLDRAASKARPFKIPDGPTTPANDRREGWR